MRSISHIFQTPAAITDQSEVDRTQKYLRGETERRDGVERREDDPPKPKKPVEWAPILWAGGVILALIATIYGALVTRVGATEAREDRTETAVSSIRIDQTADHAQIQRNAQDITDLKLDRQKLDVIVSMLKDIRREKGSK